jgi:hypothetical protein
VAGRQAASQEELSSVELVIRARDTSTENGAETPY